VKIQAGLGGRKEKVLKPWKDYLKKQHRLSMNRIG
jgi:hypothetical protein